MAKLQPIFSWQKYEGAAEDSKEQFQYQLGQEHIVVANSINATIDDQSYFTRARQTSFTWLDNKPIWTKTITGTIVGTAVTNYPHGITNIDTVIEIKGAAQQQKPLTGTAVPLPSLDPNTLANSVGIYMDATNLIIDAANNNLNGFLFSATIYYTKT